jgi:SAM-dependent methyltransferase
MGNTPRQYWDGYFQHLSDEGRDLDWGGRWTEPLLGKLRSPGVKRVVDLGCGTGADVARLADAGFDVVGVDFSEVALARARERLQGRAGFVQADLAQGLPFPDDSFDAAFGNVALHMFSDRVTRSVFADIQRVVKNRGVFVFHVNAMEDRELRARRRAVAAELEPNYVLETAGQTVRFFSRDYLLELLAGWRDVSLEFVEIADNDTGEPFKRVWRGIAER